MACLFHTSGKMVPPQYSPSDTTSARSPLAVVQSALVEERGHSTRALSYLAQARLGEMVIDNLLSNESLSLALLCRFKGQLKK